MKSHPTRHLIDDWHVERSQTVNSEVAALRQRIETECVAMKQALSGYAVVSKHEIIACRFKAIEQHQKQLSQWVGEQEAQRICYETYEHIISTPDGRAF